MTILDLLFPVVGTRLPTDHCYPLYAALARWLPRLHEGSLPFAMASITGQPVGQGLLHLDRSRSVLRLRVPTSSIADVLPLAGKTINVMGCKIALGVPKLCALKPTPSLFARTVTFKHATEPTPFMEAARKQLDGLGIGGKLRIPDHLSKDGRKEPHRHIIRIKDSRIICFSLIVYGLAPLESLRLQENGLGGRRHMGGGLFVPVRDGEDGHEV